MHNEVEGWLIVLRQYSWKQKIDPAFAKFIKFYLEFLTVTHLPGNKGFLAIDDRNLKTLDVEGFPSLASMYEHDNPEDAASDFGVLVDDTFTLDDLNEIKNEMKKKKKGIFAFILEYAEMMQEESRKYYRSAFDIFSSEETYKKYIADKSEIEVNELGRKAASDINSFVLNSMIIPFENEKEELRKSLQLRNIKYSTRMIKRHIFYTWDAISLLVNKATLKEIYRKAKEGDDESLFKLIKVDKTVFDFKWVRTRINKAAYSADWEFLDLLGEAIKEEPLKHDSRKDRVDRLFVVIKFFWNIGLYRLSDSELFDLLISDSICSNLEMYDNFESFQKFMQKHRPYLPK